MKNNLSESAAYLKVILQFIVSMAIDVLKYTKEEKEYCENCTYFI